MSNTRNVDNQNSSKRDPYMHSSIYRAVFDPDGRGLEPLTPSQLVIFEQRRRARAENPRARVASINSGNNPGGHAYGSYGARVRAIRSGNMNKADDTRLCIPCKNWVQKKILLEIMLQMD